MQDLTAFLVVSTMLALPRVASAEGFLVEWSVAADSFASSSLGGASVGCSAPAKRPRSGSAVFLKLEEEKARRDEETVSYILRKDLNLLYVLFHGSNQYSELHLPLKQRKIDSSFKKSMGELGSEYHRLRLEGEIQQIDEKVGSWPVTLFGGTVANQLGRRLEVRIGYSKKLESLPAIGEELELLIQKLRFEGDDWITLVSSSTHVPAIWEENLQLPEVQVRYREQITSVTETIFADVDFEVPEDYREVPYDPYCVLKW